MTMDELLQIGRLRAKTDPYKRKKDFAIHACKKALADSEKPYLSLSGGKDSVAMAFIVAEAAEKEKKEVRIWSHLSDASFPGTLEIIMEIGKRLNVPVDIHWSEVSAFDVIGQKSNQKFGKRGYFFESVKEYAKDKDLSFVGVRAAESKRRMSAAKAHGVIFYSASMGNVTVCNPLLWFTLEDVAAALYEYNAPIHPIYYKKPIEFGKNVNKEHQFIRLGYVTATDLLHKGMAVFLNYNYPGLFNKLATAYPEVRTYV